jgi:ligand-binding SRPBCC domain-containing protein
MTLYSLHRTQTLDISLEAAWEFFSSPANLARITPPWLGFKVMTPDPPPMHAGQILEYTVSGLPGLRMNWVTEITHVREPGFFVDEQRLGPYRFWHHKHYFRSVPGGTQVSDLVHYALPLWPLGELARGLVRSRLETIFDFRSQTLARMFGEV